MKAPLLTSFLKSTTVRPPEIVATSIRPNENTLAPGDRGAGLVAALSSKKISALVAKTSLSIAAALLLLLSARSSVFAAGGTIFTDVTVSAGLNETGFAFGDPIWGDFDNDGDLDLWVDNHYNRAPFLYQNNGHGTFTNIC